jgi:hypothetical protein
MERPFARLPETDSGEARAREGQDHARSDGGAHRQAPIIYTDVTFHREVLEGELPGYNFWLRSVAAEPQEIYRDRPWLFWQFTTTGYVPGSRSLSTATCSTAPSAIGARFCRRAAHQAVGAQRELSRYAC